MNDSAPNYPPEMNQVGPGVDYEPALMEILAGLNQRKFFFHFQPILALQSGAQIGSEMLIRWMHRGRILLPASFFPVIEKHRLIKALDQYVIHEVERMEWEHAIRPDAPFRVFINVTMESIMDPAFLLPVAEIAQKMKSYGLIPVIELAERTHFYPAVLVDGLESLRGQGVEIALDDFGSGCSSISRLVNLPLDILKIDRHLTETIGLSERGEAVLESILGLSEKIGMKIVVEGVETQAQAAWLAKQASACWVQGYYFGYPQPMEISAPGRDGTARPNQGAGR